MKRLLPFILFFAPIHWVAAATWYVAPASVGNGSGSSCSNAAAGSNLQAVINGAAPNDIIQLLGGTFLISSSIDINKPLTIEGAGMGTTTITCAASTVSLSPFSITANNVTVKNLTLKAFPGATNNAKGFFIKGKTGANIINVEFKDMPSGQNSEIIFIDNALGTVNATIDGCWFHNNSNSNCIKILESQPSKPVTVLIKNSILAATDNSRSFPAGVYYEQTDGSTTSPVNVTIDNCVFSCLATNARGGAIGLYGGTGSLDPMFTITNCTFTGNSNTSSTEGGGAVYLARRIGCAVSGCLFENNTSNSDAGGALYADGISTQDVLLSLTGCIFRYNTGTNAGAVHFRKPSPSGGQATLITNCLFHNNTSSGGSGAISTESTSFNVTVNSSTFTANDGSGTTKEAINAINGGTFLITSSIVWANPTNGTTSDEILASGTTGTINNSVFVVANATGFSGTGNSETDPVLDLNFEPTSGTPAGYRVPAGGVGGIPGNFDITDEGGCLSRSFDYPVPMPFCINPVTESGTATTDGGTAVANVAANDFVNGVPAVLGAGGNATVAEAGASWPVGISLNTATGAVIVAPGTPEGVYNLTYELCDVVTFPPSCSTIEIEITVTASLPVTWLGFEVSERNGTAELIWETASEQNNQFFEVQHSTNSFNWAVIGNKPSDPESSTRRITYVFNHINPVKGNNYYRIRQVDVDGKYTYSPIRVMNLLQSNNLVAVWPNPASEYVLISGETEIQRITISGLDGTIVRTIKMAAAQGELIGLEGLPAGAYIINVIFNTGESSQHRLAVGE